MTALAYVVGLIWASLVAISLLFWVWHIAMLIPILIGTITIALLLDEAK